MSKLVSIIRAKWAILKYLTVQEDWRSYTRLNGGKWTRVKLPRSAGFFPTFFADPFLFRHDGANWLFFETMTRDYKGILGCSKEVNGKWIFQGIALEEPWHLSYPQVFEEGGKIWMVPESCKGGKGDVCLYEAVEFPLKWRKVKVLIDKPFADSTILKHEGRWYMACYEGGSEPHAELWHADALGGPWAPHPVFRSITQTKSLMRCGGRFVEREGVLYRVAQDCNGFYGIRLWQVPVTDISPTSYHEGEARVMIDKQDEPKGMKHTFNEVVYDGNRLEVIDLHWNALRPMKTIIHNLASLLLKRI